MIEKLADNCDILIHDSTFLDKEDAEKYNHSTPGQAAEVAKKAGVNELICLHTLVKSIKILKIF